VEDLIRVAGRILAGRFGTELVLQPGEKWGKGDNGSGP